MLKEFLEAGRIVGTHGVHGEVRAEPWCDSPSFLAGFKTWYVGGRPLAVETARVHKRLVLAKLAGVGDIPAAQALRGAVVTIRRADAALPEGRFFIQDILGFSVADEATGEDVGTLTDVWPGGQDVYVVTDGDGAQRMIPNVPAFVRRVDLDGGVIHVALIEGM
jgi:16S rRNA processing protein RimM